MDFRLAEGMKNLIAKKLIELTECNIALWNRGILIYEDTVALSYESSKKDYSLWVLKKPDSVSISLHKGWFKYTLKVEDDYYREKRKHKGLLDKLWNLLEQYQKAQEIIIESKYQRKIQDKIDAFMQISCPEKEKQE